MEGKTNTFGYSEDTALLLHQNKDGLNMVTVRACCSPVAARHRLGGYQDTLIEQSKTKHCSNLIPKLMDLK